MRFRDLTSLESFRKVVELEKVVWGYTDSEDVVPVPILAVTVKRGGILVGAFDECDEMVGFVYSMPAVKSGRPTQWSHMLGVVESARNAGTGHLLKLEQRQRALAMGIELIEWTYDPLQALNAHLNFRKLGIVVGEYEENIYGESSSPLHRGNPTDRFVAEWWVRSPHVERRLSGSRPGGHAAEIEQAASVNKTRRADGWLECESSDLSLANARLGVEIPIGFSEMLIRRPDLALAWRIETRKIFTHYFARGYRAVEFFLDREKGRGTYLLTSEK